MTEPRFAAIHPHLANAEKDPRKIIILINGNDITKENALDWSIEKWELNIGFLEDNPTQLLRSGSLGCALCYLYAGRECVGCPVEKATGLSACLETPYITFCQQATNADLLFWARKELEFLKGLRE